MKGALRAALAQRLGSSVRATQPLGGGDINDAYAVELDSGDRVFVKTHANPPKGMYGAEAQGLRWLGETGAIRVPNVLAFSDDPPAYLALELLSPAPKSHDFDETLGRALASLHAYGAESFGLERSNFIGRLAQHNTPSLDWASFYWTERLEAQLQLAVDADLIDAECRRDFGALEKVIRERVGPSEAPARLHGDLWGGNLHVDERGAPCVIDPAVYGGHREVDLAMMRLFGGFSENVFRAYAEARPLADGSDVRVPLYQLYPLLVHVNLFGGGYLGSVKRALRRCL